jgi:hypothetical protein
MYSRWASVKLGRWCDLDEFLVAALDRTVALVEVNAVAVTVADDLHLDMLRVDHALFDEDLRLAEGLAGFGDDPFVILDQVVFGIAAPNTASAAAVGGLEHDRVADAVGQDAGFLGIFQIVVGTGRHRDAGLDHGLAGGDLVAHLGG